MHHATQKQDSSGQSPRHAPARVVDLLPLRAGPRGPVWARLGPFGPSRPVWLPPVWPVWPVWLRLARLFPFCPPGPSVYAQTPSALAHHLATTSATTNPFHQIFINSISPPTLSLLSTYSSFYSTDNQLTTLAYNAILYRRSYPRFRCSC